MYLITVDLLAGHGADLVGLARWLAQAERFEEAVSLYRRAVDLGLPDNLLFKTLWEIGRLEKKLERYAAAVAVFTDLAAAKNPYRVSALEELAKYFEGWEISHYYEGKSSDHHRAVAEIVATKR